MMNHTGALRDKMTHFIWLNCDASEGDVKEVIMNEVGCSRVTYLYAQGKNLRFAKLSDIEHAENWDVETIKALMGSGSLYVTYKVDDVDCEEPSVSFVLLFVNSVVKVS